MKTPILFWLARLVAAIIMVQTLYFKFTAAPESVFIFSTVGMEPWGRWLVGFLELVASVMLFIPAAIWLGSILAIGLMAGAVGMHLTLLGIEVQGDGGQLFIYALVVLICTLYSFWKSRQTIPAGLQKFLPSFLK
ncbi:MAG: DoxX family protein [Bacteroidetes bacterium OLB12]|nr:MAG: DoxX family protein [Bacteroidetes bacterium OLB12]MCE7864107.1 DoxX family protein [Bacteroidetes bacterium CHB5]